MSEKGLVGLLHDWDAVIADSNSEDTATGYAYADAMRHTKQELQPFLERLKGLEQEWRKQYQELPPTAAGNLTAKVFRQCADELAALIHGTEQAEGRDDGQ